MQLGVAEIIRTYDGAIVSPRPKLRGNRLSNTAAVGKDEPRRGLRAIGIRRCDGPLRHPGYVVQQFAGTLARFTIRFCRDPLHPKTQQFAHDAAIFVKHADVRLEKFRPETAARPNDAVTEEPRTRPRQKSQACDPAG